MHNIIFVHTAEYFPSAPILNHAKLSLFLMILQGPNVCQGWRVLACTESIGKRAAQRWSGRFTSERNSL